MNRKSILRIVSGVLLAMTSVEAKPVQPNIIFIYADDLGAGLLGCYGQKIIKTPNIDRLSAQGMQFSNSHGCVYCAPARASLITGLHDAHKGAWNIIPGGGIIALDEGKVTEKDLQKSLKKAIPAKKGEIFLGQIFQQAGYKTAQFGKLEWGFLTSHERLKRHGWDHYVGYMDHQRAHGFYPTFLWRDGKKMPMPGNTHKNAGKTVETYGPGTTEKRRDRTGKKTYSQDVFIKHILQYIRDHKDQPFFIYHPTQLPHGPVDIPEVHPDFIKDKRLTDVEKEYASMVKMLDDHIGLIMDEVKSLGLDKKTMIVFASDNGHEQYYWERSKKRKARDGHFHGEDDVFQGSQWWAGKKWTDFEGGIRVPLIVRWPEKIQPGSKSDRLTAGYDYMATFAEAIGVTPPKGKDGISFLPTLMGKEQAERDYIIVRNSILSGEWKLIKTKKETLLFNLKNDPGERHNLLSKHPEKAKELEAKFNQENNSQRRDL